MTGRPSFIPEGYHAVTPYLVVRDVNGLIAFLQKVFDAKEGERMPRPDGSIAHAEVRIGDSTIMMGEAIGSEEIMPAMLYVYLEDTDTAYQRALAAGATSLREPRDEFYGDRSAGVQDPFGNQWWLATRLEEVSEDELRQRWEDQVRKQDGG